MMEPGPHAEEGLDGIVALSPTPFLQRLQDHCHERLALLRASLQAVEDRSIFEFAESTRPPSNRVGSFQFALSDSANASARTLAIHDAFVAIVRSFLDFVDSCLAQAELFSEWFSPTRDLDDLDEVQRYLIDLVDKRTEEIGARKNLRNREKLDRFSHLVGFEREACDGLLAMRQTIEHHKGVVQRPFVFAYYDLRFYVDDDVVTSLPVMIRKGSRAGAAWEQTRDVYTTQQHIALEEFHLECIVHTVQLHVVPTIIRSITEMAQRSGRLLTPMRNFQIEAPES